MTSKLPPEIRWLVRQARPYWGLYLVRLSTVVIASLLILIDPLIIKWIIDDVLPWRNASMLIVAAVAYFVVYVTRYGFNSLGFVLDSYTSQRVLFDIRLKLLRHLQKLSPSYYLHTSQGDLLHRIEKDVDQIQALGGQTLAVLLRISVMTTLTIVIMSILNWKLTLVILPLAPLMMVLRRFGYPRLRAASDRTQETNSARMSFLQDHLSFLPQVQLLNREAGERRRFAGLARTALGATVDRRIKELGLSFVTSAHFFLATAVVLGFGGQQVLAGALTVGGLVAFYTYLSRIFGPLEVLTTMYTNLQRASASIRRIREVLAEEPRIRDPQEPKSLPSRGPVSVRFESLEFSYSDHGKVVDGLDLSLEPGEKVALVGPSGCGKSTLARLLTRMYDPGKGRILIQGVDVRHVRLRTLRQSVALVPQEPVLFDVSLQENLRYGSPNATDDDLREALEIAQLDQLPGELEDGWQERMGARGERLSGGQRQRVAIARAVLQDPRLLILDEATSALDGLTERRLLEALDEVVQNRTTILIAHRLSAIRWTDRIVLIHQGRVEDDGTHEELSRRSSLYRDLCEKQLVEDQAAEVPRLEEVLAS